MEDGFGIVFSLSAEGVSGPLPDGTDGFDGRDDGGPGRLDSNLILTLPDGTGPETSVGPMFTRGGDSGDLRGPISAFSPSYGPPLRQRRQHQQRAER